jgi:hypothetical protein
MTERLFTPAEVDRLIPKLAELMGQAIERHRQAQDFAEALRAERERIRAAGGTAEDRREWKARTERLDGLTIEVRGFLEEVPTLGGVVKDVEMGLVDFTGLVPGRGGVGVGAGLGRGEGKGRGKGFARVIAVDGLRR